MVLNSKFCRQGQGCGARTSFFASTCLHLLICLNAPFPSALGASVTKPTDGSSDISDFKLTCEFYEQHAYPAGYNVHLNVSCGDVGIDKGVSSISADATLGLHVTRDFPIGETVAWIPDNAHIWEPTVPWKIRHAVAAACEPRAYEESVLAVALLVEKRNKDSRFKHYIAALARMTQLDLQNIVTFTKDHMAVLNVTRPDLVSAFLYSMKCIEKSEAQIPALQEAPTTRGERLWAYGVVKSRAVKTKGRLALVPVVDLANHARPANAEIVPFEPKGTQFRALRNLEEGEQLTLDYGLRVTNLELLANHGFVVPHNPSGMLLPFDFNSIYGLEDDDDEETDNPSECFEALRSPQLWRDRPLLLDAIPEKCLTERLFRYYDRHYTEIDVINDFHIRLKALELIGRLCAQILAGYKKVAPIINRLRQHGQRAKDWATMQVTHEAVEDMRLLQFCVDGAKNHQSEEAAKARDDL